MASTSVVAISADISQFNNAMNAMESQWKETFNVANAAIIKANESTRKYEAGVMELGKAKATLAGIDRKNTAEYQAQKRVVDDLTVSVKQLNAERSADVKVASSLKRSTAQAQRDLEFSRKSAEYAKKNEIAIRSENRALKDKLLINTKAQQIERKYADLLKEVAYWQKKGILTTKEATLAQQRLTVARKQDLLAATRSNVARNSATNDLVRHVRQLETLIVGLYAVKRAYDFTLGVGHEFNKMMEAETIGIALSIVQKLKDVDVTNQAVTSMEKWAYANQKAKEEIEEVRKINPFTPHTLEQTIQLYKTISGQVRAAGGNTQNALDSTKNLSIIAQAANVDFKAMLKTVDQLYAGRMKPSDMQIALSNILGLTQESIRAAKASGNVVEFINDKLKNAAIAAADVEQSWAGVTSNFVNSWTDIFSELQKPLFDSMKRQIKEFTVLLLKNKDEIVGFVQGVSSAIKDNFDIAAITIGMYGAQKAALGLLTITTTLNKSLLITRTLVLGTLGAFLYFADDIDSMGGAAERLADYFRLGFATIKTIVFGAAESILSFIKSIPEAATWAMADLKLGFAKGMNTLVDIVRALADGIPVLFDIAWTKVVRGIYSIKSAIGNALNEAMSKPWNEAILYMQDKWHKFLLFIGVDSIDPVLSMEGFIDIKGADEDVAKLTAKISLLKDELKKPVSGPQLIETGNLEADAEAAAEAYAKAFSDPSNAPWLKEQRIEAYEEMIAAFTKLEAASGKSKDSVAELNKLLTQIDFDPNKTTLGAEADDGKAVKAASDAAKAAKEALALSKKWAAYEASRSQTAFKNQIDLLKATNKWSDTLSGIPKIVDDISKEFKNLAITQLTGDKALDKLESDKNKNLVTFAEDSIKMAEIRANYDEDELALKQQLFSAQIAGYASVAGAMAGAFEEGTTASKAFMGIQQALSLYNAVVAVTGAWALPYPANIPAVIATTAAVSALLAQVGQTFGGSGSASGSAATPPEIGDSTQKESDSLANALDDIYDVEYSMLSLTRDMRGYLSVIAQAFGNIESTLYRSNVDIAGDTFESQVTRSTSALEGTEVDIGAQTLGDMMVGELDATLAWIVEYTSSSWLGSGTSRYETYTVDIANAFSDELAMAAQATFDSFRLLGSELNIDTTGLENQVIDIGRIDTTGMDSGEVAAAIEARFSADVDYIAERYFSVLQQYTEGSEGLFETAARVVVNMEQVTHSLNLLGVSLDDTSVYMFQLTEAMIDGAGGIDDLMSGFSDYMDSFFTEQEQYDMQLANMAVTFASLGVALPSTNDEFRALVEGINLSTVAGAELFGELMTISGAFAELTDMGEALSEVLGTTLSDIALYIDYLSGTQDFSTRTLSLSGADSISMAAYAITVSEEMLRAIEIQTELSGITVDNYLSQLELAHLNDTLTSNQLENWQTLGDALLTVEEATKTYTDLILAEEERLADERAKLNDEAIAEAERLADAVAASTKAIADAWLGNLSYLSLAQKAEYATQYFAVAKDSGGTISTVDAALSAAQAAMESAATKEEYIPAFERYIMALEDEVPESTLDDVVIKLDDVILAVKELEDTTIRVTPEGVAV